MEVWDYDTPNDDDIVDIFSIQLSSPLSVFDQSNPLTVQGYYGLGNLTLSYGNLTMESTSCSSMDSPTSMHAPEGIQHTKLIYNPGAVYIQY